MDRVTVKVEGSVNGFKEEGETRESAIARNVLLAESLVNEKGTVRLHLFLPEKPEKPEKDEKDESKIRIEIEMTKFEAKELGCWICEA